MKLTDILNIYDQDISQSKVRLVRHADSKWDLTMLLRTGNFEEYQARQKRDVFGKCDYIVSFIGEGRTRSRMLGVYSVDGVSKKVPAFKKSWPYPSMPRGIFRYRLTKLEPFRDIENRLIIDWGSATRQWVQWLKPASKDKDVVELLPQGPVHDFPGFDDHLLSFEQLANIIHSPDANRTWHTMLKSVAGVYLITDNKSGELYVGSAYGKDGLLGRWTDYVRTKHGGNKRLKERLSKRPKAFHSFSYSILRTLPKSMTNKEVIEVEGLYKRKLGSRAFGLNDN